MKQIPLTNKDQILGYAQVDDEDYDYLMRWSWRLHDKREKERERYTDYAVRIKRKGVKGAKGMHRIIMQRYHEVPSRILVDHEDGNGLNNQKSNLRLCTHSQNSMNKVKNGDRPYSSCYKGVSFQKRVRRWRAELTAGRRRVYCQLFDNEMDAVIAYDIKARQHFGPFAKCNLNDVTESDLQRVTSLLKHDIT